MPHARPDQLPAGGGGRWPFAGEQFRSTQWGDLEIGFTTVDAPSDSTVMYQLGGLAGGVCPCPHYGYVFSGSVRAVYPGTDKPDEVAVAGEVYYFPAGHVLKYDEPTQALELNPASALVECMDAMARAYEKLTAQAEATQPEGAPA